MPSRNWTKRIYQQLRGVNPFAGDCLPSRVSLFKRGRPTTPIPLPWNYKEPIKIFEAFYTESETDVGWKKHNRYLYAGGFPPVLVTRDPGIIKAIQAATGDKPGQFDRDTSPTAGIARATGKDSLLYANGSTWRHQKSLVTKPFSRSNLFQPQKFHGFEQTFRKTVKKRLDALQALQKSSNKKRSRVELEPEIKTIMLEMLVNNFFGADVPYDELRERFVPALVYMIDHMIRDTVAPRSQALARKFSGSDQILNTHQTAFEELTDQALAGRSKGLGLWKDFESDASDENLRSNIRVFLAGAMEATTSFATWAISHLARSPDWQDKVYQEVKHMNVYHPDDFTAAPHLNQVLDETLRLTPSLYFFPRKATEDTWIETSDHRKMMIPKDTHIRLDVWHSNRCEEFWGKEKTGYPAIDFAPERWDVIKERGIPAKEMLHFGFGHGPRFCPGRSLGLLEVGLVVGAAVKLFKFDAVQPHPAVKAGVSTKPADGVLVDLELRSDT